MGGSLKTDYPFLLNILFLETKGKYTLLSELGASHIQLNREYLVNRLEVVLVLDIFQFDLWQGLHEYSGCQNQQFIVIVLVAVMEQIEFMIC